MECLDLATRKKVEDVKYEMTWLGINVLGISETRWLGEDDYESFRIIHSGGEESQRGVAIILDNRTANCAKKVRCEWGWQTVDGEVKRDCWHVMMCCFIWVTETVHSSKLRANCTGLMHHISLFSLTGSFARYQLIPWLLCQCPLFKNVIPPIANAEHFVLLLTGKLNKST